MTRQCYSDADWDQMVDEIASFMTTKYPGIGFVTMLSGLQDSGGDKCSLVSNLCDECVPRLLHDCATDLENRKALMVPYSPAGRMMN